MYVLAQASRCVMQTLNTTVVQGAEHMDAAFSRESGVPLITVCNHVASIDDPLVMSTVVPPQLLTQPNKLRCGSLCQLASQSAQPVSSASQSGQRLGRRKMCHHKLKHSCTALLISAPTVSAFGVV